MVLEPLKVAILVGSMREGRLAPQVAGWFVEQAGQRADMVLDVIDIVDYPLPNSLDENHPMSVQLRPRLLAADAFVLVVPEYNRSIPGPFKTVIDFGNKEWEAKPVGFVSYGLSMAGGVRAVEHLRQIFAEFNSVGMKDVVIFPRISEHFVEHRFSPDPAAGAAAKIMLDQLAWWANALRDAKVRHPYGT
ncbi:NADPH-dependent FMN reductase [Dactylosporangium sp. CA-139066]|uniref:NADPH-dependent FMN reductase n=1 Tax=Dactylosporangium sp. CA-139066 TaxID=3239930 RepID=UPI003D8FB921